MRVLRPGGHFVLREPDADDESMAQFISVVHTVFNAGLREHWAVNAAKRRHFGSQLDARRVGRPSHRSLTRVHPHRTLSPPCHNSIPFAAHAFVMLARSPSPFTPLIACVAFAASPIRQAADTITIAASWVGRAWYDLLANRYAFAG